MFVATATATCSECASGSASGSGNTLDEAIQNANKSAILAAQIALRKPIPNNPDQDVIKAVLLNCIDFRLLEYADYFLDTISYLNNFDQFILAGASLGYNGINGYSPNWQNCCNDHITLAHDLHEISEIIIIDHLSCGAYKLSYTAEQLEGDGEYNLHVENLNKAEITIKKKFPFILKVKKFIMGLDGNVSYIP